LSAATPGRLHVITDETVQSSFSHAELAVLAADGGADTVQFREKRAWSTVELVRVARLIRERLAGRGVRLIVNDRVDVAAAAAADGVHLGPTDLDPLSARRLLGPRALIGATANDLARAGVAARGPVAYLGVGPVFGTGSKRDPAPTLGVDGLRRIVAAVEVPVVAIGNITPERVAEVLSTGAHGVAVLSDVSCAADPAARVAVFAAAIQRSSGERIGA
jgi:thiamine-phosphate pyrophosphorylase